LCGWFFNLVSLKPLTIQDRLINLAAERFGTITMAEDHRQAAIMFTDLVGYTALMEKNESGALELIKKNRNLHQTVIQKHNGQLVKEMGDGFMATFDNTLDALSCAQEIQAEAKAREFDIPVRIGIHYGDITIDQDDIFSHGVNMASRIQSIADPGGIYISESIHEMIHDRKDFETQYMGAVPLKNIKDPVDTYALKGEGLPPPEKKRIEAIIRRSIYLKYYRYAGIGAILIIAVVSVWFIRTFDIERAQITKSVAVLPLEDLSEDPELEYLSSGMTDELIKELSKVSALTVILQNSTKQYAGIVKPFSEISQELNEVNYIVDGTIILKNNKIVAEIRLINPIEDQVIWNQKYEREISTTRQLWAQIAQDLTRMMGIFVPEENTALWTGIKPVNPETYELYLKGMHAIDKSPPNIQKGLSYFNEAIDKNPADAYSWAGLANAYIKLGHSLFPTKDVRQKANAAALRAIRLDTTLAEAWYVLGTVKAYYEWDLESAEQAYQKANSLNPSLPWYLVLFGRMNEAIQEHKKVKALDPFSPYHTAWLGSIYNNVGEYDKAIAEAKLALELPDKFMGKTILADIYLTMGREEEAVEICEQLAAEFPPAKYFSLGTAYILSGKIEEGKKILNELETEFDSIPSPFGAYIRTRMYAALGDYDNAYKWCEFEPHFHYVPWIRTAWNIKYSKDSSFIKDPRFKALMRRINLPDPASFQYDPDLDL
jgi:class 3 adenylate cyclase/TolB-like protein/tetratricopeptide (TPR) repeat protein